MNLKDANSMAMSGLSIRMALVSTLVANYRVTSPVCDNLKGAACSYILPVSL